MLRDLLYGLRQTRRHRGVAIVVIVTIGLAVGADATVFSAINALLLRALPVAHPERLVRVVANRAEELSWSEFETLRDATDRVALVAFTGFRSPVIEEHGGRIESLAGERVSERYFEVMTGAPLQGVLISDALRQRWFSDGDVIGRSLKINGIVYTVAGVAPAGFRGTNFAAPADIWLPLEKLDRERVRVIGRLAAGATMKDAGARLEAVAKAARPPFSIRIGPERAMLINPSSPRVVVTGVTVALLLGALSVLVAAANIVSVLVARVVLRRRELLIRMSLGAQRQALVRQLVTESMPLALPAALLAWIVARFGSRVYTLFLPVQAIPAIDFSPDSRVVLFSFGLSLLVIAGATLGAALHVTSSLDRAGRASRSSRLLPAIAIGQLALAVVVLVTAALLVRTAQAHTNIRPGFETAHQLIVPVDADRATDMALRIRELPAVAAVTIARNAPLGRQLHVNVQIAGQPVAAQWTLIDRGYFDALGIPMVRGRDFTSNERNRVAIVNETLARALGKDSVLRIDGRPEPFTIVGVARDVHYSALTEPSAPYVYLPLPQGPLTAAVLLVRTTRDTRLEIGALLTSQGVAPSVFALADSVRADLWLSRTASVVAGAPGLLSALLAAVGLFGVVSMSVQSRGRELAVRSALGATPASLGVLVARGSGRLLLIGLGAGALLAALMARALSAVLFGITPFDPASWVASVGVITIAVVAATAIPFFRAMTPMPISLLREE
jgi:putative ABC transport system permease protein